MSSPAMVGEVNRLIGSLLASGRALGLPGIGALLPERVGAKRLSARTVRPPYRTVAFSSQEQGMPLPEAIARAAGCDEAQARGIYDRWLAYALSDEALTVEGVGVLKQRHFSLDPAFDLRLNPQGHAPVRLHPRRKFDWALWLGVAAIVVAAGFGGWQFLQMQPDPVETLPAAERALPADPDVGGPSEPADALAEAIAPERLPDQADAGEESLPQDASRQEGHPVSSRGATETGTKGRTGTTDVRVERSEPIVARLVSGRRYVVLGVFSTEENAIRAAGDAQRRVSEVHPSVYAFGAKWMVSPFDSDDAAACTRFVNEYDDRFPGLWVYTAR